MVLKSNTGYIDREFYRQSNVCITIFAPENA